MLRVRRSVNGALKHIKEFLRVNEAKAMRV